MFLQNEIASRRPEVSAAKPTSPEKRRRERLPRGGARQPIPRRAAGRNQAPLSFAQQRLWFLDQLHPESPLYNFPVALRMTGPLNREALQRALSAIVARHEVLRTRFISIEGDAAQVISAPANVDLPVVDLSGMVKAARETEMRRLLQAEAEQPFNLANDLMLRCLLLKLEASEHVLMITIHHIATDAWSAGIFSRELSAYYGAFNARRPFSLSELPVQYADYAIWQREWLQGEVLDRHLAYWKQQLAGAKEFLELPIARPRPAAQTFHGGVQTHPLRRDLIEDLKRLSRSEGVTLFMTLLAAFKTLLHRYSHQDDILVGSPIAGRSRIETEGSIGFFVNTLVLRTDLSGNPTFRELLQRVRDVAFGAFEHQDLPFERLVEELHPERSASQMPLIQTMFVLQNAPAEELKLADLSVTPVEVTQKTSKFDLTLFIDEHARGFTASFEYNADLFDAATIARMRGHFEMLLEGIAADPGRRLSDLPLMTETERQQVLVDWNQTQTDFPRNRCVHELFEEQARERPDAIAVVFGRQMLTYGQLNARANQLAHCLVRAGVSPGMAVGLCAERSLELIVGLLGILKAGGAYVALDPATPRLRLAGMLEDLRSPVLVIQHHLAEILPGNPARIASSSAPLLVCLDADWKAITQESTDNLPNRTTAESLAYVSFTSGSTGRPKGVCVPHRGVTRLVRNTYYANFAADEVFLQLAPVSFDASTLEIWGALLNGARLALMPPQAFSLSDLADAIERHHVTTVFLTSGLFNRMVEEKPEGLRNLRQLLTGGEVLSVPHVKKALLSLPITCRLFNVYGPTENTTFSTCHPIPLSFDDERPTPIGRPISNTQCYILDEQMQPVPIGVMGELYLGGDGLALGYLNQPEMTAEKFVPYLSGARLYRTGDLVRHLADGNIEFVGRKDLQVKIRGFRVELGEVETVLRGHPAVRQCAVNAHESTIGGKRLVAYVVTEPGLKLTLPEWRDFLKEKLPEYMIPAAFVRLDSLPLTATGKVDRKALPEPKDGLAELERKYVGPRDELEAELTGIWEAVLGVNPIGVEDKFFDLGGHSLLAVRLLAQVEKKLGRKLPLAVVFQAPTISRMARVLRENTSGASGRSVVEIQARGAKPPLFFVHGVGGGMFWGYTNLARSLGVDQPVFALKSRAMDGKEEFSRIEEMAAQYVADIRAFQPRGPYHLGGYCFGGDVAYEMARQLEDAGEKVALLAIMNCSPPNSNYGRFRWNPVTIFRFLRNLTHLVARSLHWGPQQQKEYLRWKAAWAKRKIMRSFRLTRRASHRVEVDDMVDLSSFPTDQRKLWETHVRALINFFPQPYRGKVTLFRSRGHPLVCSYDPQYGWGDLAAEVESHIVPGAHESILEHPHVEVLAERLKECLRELHGKKPPVEKTAAAVPGAGAPAEWNQTRADYPRELCVHHLFEEQVKRTPDAPAVIWEGQALTYDEVNGRANRIAHLLQSLGVGPDVPVGICLERSFELVIGLLGILKAGGAYVPLDPAYPKERLALMLENSQAPVLLTGKKFAGTLPSGKARVICLDTDLPETPEERNPSSQAGPDNLAYVIYTSGSTGLPKGVAMRHQPLVNLIWWQLKNSILGKGDRTVQFASPSFDVSFQEIFSTWCAGGVLMLVGEELRHDPARLLRFLREQNVNRLFLPFIALNQLAECFNENEAPPGGLREIITAGEQLRVTDKMARLFGKLPDCTLHNQYGPSESHVVTFFTLRGAPEGWPSLPPIGRPIANTQIHLLDEKLNPVPVGEPGELYIGGECLARGYLHRPDLTAERFIADPFNLEPGARLYKTGDLARYLPDGNIEFLGRMDHQVKIRGYRVELSEIETVLGRHPQVRECVVTAREDVPGQKRLVAYVAPQPGQEINVTELRRVLQEKLPDYMTPSAFVFLEALPLTPSGKVNRLALPAPDQNRPQLDGEYVSPRDETEEKIAGIWREVLNLKQVGAQDNFFELGGHSLLAAQVVSRVREVFNVELPVASLFDAPTVAALGAEINSGRWAHELPTPPIQPVTRSAKLPLSFAQRRLWFIDRLEPGGHAYNVPVALHLDGMLNVGALQRSLNEIVRRHEILRTTISFADGNLTQVISSTQDAPLHSIDLENRPKAGRTAGAEKLAAEEARRPFDLERGPLLRCTLLRLDEREHILVVVMHHIISDGWSLAVFFNELDSLYNALAAGKPAPALPALPVQYADYAVWQQQWMQGPVLERELGWWKEKLQEAPPSIELPLDHAAEPDSPRSAQCSIILPKTVTEQVVALGRREGVTPFMAMMAGLAATLHSWTEQSDLVIGTVVAGRNRRELENLAGCFMNFVPVRTRINDRQSGRELLEHVKRTVLEANAHQECPFEKMVEAINPERRLAQNPLYNVAFLMQNFPAGALNGKDLKAKAMPVDLQAALLDLRFIAEESPEGISLACEYKTGLFEARTIEHLLNSFNGVLAALVQEPEKTISQIKLTPELAEQARAAKARQNRQAIAIAATFTAEPVEESLRHWMRELQIPVRLEFAPYNQVFQQLLDPAGVFSRNLRGANVVLARLEDWERFEGGAGASAVAPEERMKRTAEEFILAMKAAAGRGAVPYLVYICPASKSALQNPERAAFHRETEKRLAAELSGLAGVYLVTSEELERFYPVADYDDPRSEEIGRIPYTPVFFAALGTLIARKIHALKRPAFKAIVLDCDQTLWAGVCGEDGAGGIQLDPPRRALQEFMRAQSDAGMLLCVCSKNNEEDVACVFERRREMPLQREHFAGWRVNWRSKPENIKSLARELRLGLDSFIFVDDNPVECAEMEAHCPEVLTLLLPEAPEQIPQFLNHCWAFDHLKLSAEDRQRTASYRQEREREQLRAQSLGLADFLGGLELKVEIAALSEPHLTRAAQLTLRTNQFNFTTRRRTESDFQTLRRMNSHEVLTASVSDRFGAYGLTGVIIYGSKRDALDVDTFLLSCRVLGRGVECRMTAELGRIALSRGLSRVDLHFVPSAKNQPAFNFLEKIGRQFRQALNGGYIYRLPAEYAAAVHFNPAAEEDSPPAAAPAAKAEIVETAGRASRAIRYRWIATEANDVGRIFELTQKHSRSRHSGGRTYTPARNETEKLLCHTWEELLRVEHVGIDDNFFELGGHSLLAVRLFAEVEKLTGRKLPLVTLFQNSTVKQLADALSQTGGQSRSSIVAIQAQGSRPPLFLVHGAGGDVLWGYANLAPYLGPDQPVYGIKSRALNGVDEFLSIEEMAAYYIMQLRSVQKEGPYHLGGYCFGGNVAYEMARQLEARGETVALVALLDAAPSNRGYERPRWWRPDFNFKFIVNLYYWLGDFFKMRAADQKEFVLRKGRAFRRKITRRFARGGSNPTEVDLEEIIDLSKFPRHELKLWQTHLNALNTHVSQSYVGRVTLFRTLGQPMFCSLEDDFGWGRLAGGGVEIKMVPGSHENIFMEPDVRSLAAQLKTCLDRSNPSEQKTAPATTP